MSDEDRGFVFIWYVTLGAAVVVYVLALQACGSECERRGGQPVYNGAGLITCVERR